MMEYIRFLYLRHAGKKGLPYVSKQKLATAGQHNSLRSKLLMKTLKESDLQGTIITRVRTKTSDAERFKNLQALEIFNKNLGLMQSPAMRSVKYGYDVALYMRDKLNLEDLPIPTLEEMQQEAARIMAMAQEMQDQEKFEKVIKEVKNPKLRQELMGKATQQGLTGRGQGGQGGTGLPAPRQG